MPLMYMVTSGPSRHPFTGPVSQRGKGVCVCVWGGGGGGEQGEN